MADDLPLVDFRNLFGTHLRAPVGLWNHFMSLSEQPSVESRDLGDNVIDTMPLAICWGSKSITRAEGLILSSPLSRSLRQSSQTTQPNDCVDKDAAVRAAEPIPNLARWMTHEQQSSGGMWPALQTVTWNRDRSKRKRRQCEKIANPRLREGANHFRSPVEDLDDILKSAESTDAKSDS